MTLIRAVEPAATPPCTDLSSRGPVAAQLAHGAAPLAPLVQTTRGVPAAQQFDLWRSSTGTMFDHAAPPGAATAGFLGEASTWRFGGLALTRLHMSAGRYLRSSRQVRRDGVDHWVLTVATAGQRIIRVGDAEQFMRPGSVFVGSLDQSFATERTDSSWLHLYVPRDAVPRLGPALAAARLRPPAGAMGMLLHDYIVLLAGQFDAVRAADAPRLAEATRAMIDAAFAGTVDRRPDAIPVIESVQIARVRRAVRENLASATFGPERLCRIAGISRSQLYRLMEPLGGVAAYIQSERLRAARSALSDPSDRRSVAQIAEAVGLFDTSSFSRMFRRAHGCSPQEMRMACLAGWSAPMMVRPPRGPAPQTITELLRQL